MAGVAEVIGASTCVFVCWEKSKGRIVCEEINIQHRTKVQ